MKRYHAVAIAALALVISALAACDVRASTPVPTAAPAPVEIPASQCPKATEYNTGWVVQDTDNDGNADHAYRVYNSGPCKLQAVDQSNAADLVLEMRP